MVLVPEGPPRMKQTWLIPTEIYQAEHHSLQQLEGEQTSHVFHYEKLPCNPQSRPCCYNQFGQDSCCQMQICCKGEPQCSYDDAGFHLGW